MYLLAALIIALERILWTIVQNFWFDIKFFIPFSDFRLHVQKYSSRCDKQHEITRFEKTKMWFRESP